MNFGIVCATEGVTRFGRGGDDDESTAGTLGTGEGQHRVSSSRLSISQ
jgi:hypothetical protein